MCVCVYVCVCLCAGQPCNATESGGLRLVGGAVEWEGRVELCIDGMWGTICDDFWSGSDASVVCHQLGLGRSGAIAYQDSHFGPGTGPTWFNNFFCTGREVKLTDCTASPPSADCTHNNDASVKCSG